MTVNERVAIVRPYAVGRSPDSTVVVIPKEIVRRLNIRRGTKLLVCVDEEGRIVYELLQGQLGRSQQNPNSEPEQEPGRK